uniref:Secreted protein n=1 Tax=Anopheles darlingi TaxID=43151 RepID=A0A2M4D8N3_ANODA
MWLVGLLFRLLASSRAEPPLLLLLLVLSVLTPLVRWLPPGLRFSDSISLCLLLSSVVPFPLAPLAAAPFPF